MSPTDTELISQFVAGKNAAFEQLVYRYDKEVLTIAARYTNNSDDAKDIYQETFIRVFKGLPKFRHDSEFSTWLFRIATNVCLTRKALKKKEVSLMDDRPLGGEEGRDHPVSEMDADGHTRSNEISEHVREALRHLSPQQRMVFVLRHYREYKIREIAVMMDCAEGTVKKYLFEATQKLRIRLHELVG